MGQRVDTLRTAAARALLALLFVGAGVDNMLHKQATAVYMEPAGVRGWLLPVVIALELGAGLAFLLGWRTRLAAWVLAAFTLCAGAIFDHAFDDPVQLALFMKNVAVVAVLLAFTVAPARRQDQASIPANDHRPGVGLLK